MKRIFLLVLVSLLIAVPGFAQPSHFLPEGCIDSFDAGKNHILAETGFMADGKTMFIVMGNASLLLGNNDSAIKYFRDALDNGKEIAESYRGLAKAYCFKGEFFLASWCYEMSRRLGIVPNPFLEARLFPGPREISNGGPPVFFTHGLEKAYFQMEGSIYLLGKRGNYVKIPIGSKARFLEKPDYLPMCLVKYDIIGSEGDFYEVYLPPDFDLLPPRKGNYSKIILGKPQEERPRRPLEEKWW